MARPLSMVKDALSMISFDAYFSPGESQKEARFQIHKPLFGLSGGLWTSGRATWFSQEFTNPRIRSPGKEHISSGRWHEHPAATDAQGPEAQVHRTEQQGTSREIRASTGEPVGQQGLGTGPQTGGTERENKAKAKGRRERHLGCRI